MTKLADIYAKRAGEPVFICDFSPPRGPDYIDSAFALSINADCLSVPYNPGKSVYANSAFAARSVKSHSRKEVAFTVATRDMNILAAQSLLVGAALLGLQNVIVVRGDDFSPGELRRVKAVNDFTPTALIRSIVAMNEGTDFHGRALDVPTDFCIGGTVDTNRSIESEVVLTRRKIDAGAHFLITQPGFTPESPLRFLQAYERAYSVLPSVPIFFGIQVAALGSRSFTPMPQSVRDRLDAGDSPAHIAVRAIDAFIAAGITSFYLMPPIYPGGARDYQSAAQVIDHFSPSTN